MNNLRAPAVGIILFIIGLFAPRLTAAQGALYVSNLGQTPTGSAAIGSDSWVAQTFITGGSLDGYFLNSVQLLMNGASGIPSGFAVSLYSKTGDPHSATTGDSPQGSLGSLSGLDPATGGVFTYATSGIMLSPSTFYFVVVTAATPVAEGSYNWSAATALTRGNGFTIDNGYYSSANGSTWTGIDRQDVFQLGIYATAVPEPATLALAGLGLACLSVWKHRHGK